MIKIPISFVIGMDDVGWDEGRDQRLSGKASRSGIPRNHAVEDYEVLKALSDKTGKNLVAALCLGDWDKDNLLRGEVGITHGPKGWDRASEIHVRKFEKYREALDNSPNIEFTVHGLLHGNYDENKRAVIDLSGGANAVPWLKRDFFISVKNAYAPVRLVNAKLCYYDRCKDFETIRSRTTYPVLSFRL